MLFRSQALQQAQQTGDWGGFNNRLAQIGQMQSGAQNQAGNYAMRQFHSPTMANAQRRNSFGNLMTAANNQTTQQLQRWAEMSLGIQRDERDAALDQQRFGYQMQRDAIGDQFRSMEYQDRSLDRKNDYDWRQKEYERSLDNDEYRKEQDRTSTEFRERELDRQEENDLLRLYSPQAVEMYRQGDPSLLDQERESGE